MEQRRFSLFIALSIGIYFAWQFVIVPRFFPPQKKPAAVASNQPKKANPAAAKGGKKDADKPAVVKAGVRTSAKASQVDLGSLDETSGYKLFATIDSLGATVSQVTLVDRHYPDELDRKHQQQIIGNEDHEQTLRLFLEGADPKFKPEEMHWEVLPGSQSQSGVTYRVQWDGLELQKEFSLPPVDAVKKDEKTAYTLRMNLTLINHNPEPISGVRYLLDGPCGLPLENKEYTGKYRDVAAKFVEDDGSMKYELMHGSAVISQPVLWPKRLQYIGVDVQYFSALLHPVDDQRESRYTESSTQWVVPDGRGTAPTVYSDISVKLTSVKLDIPGKGDGKNSITHSYELFAGPKRDDLVDADVLNYGWFSVVSRLLLPVLHFFYSIFGSYGIAIVCLTVVVRSMLLPLSIRQAKSAAKMQDLQPELTAIKEKYAGDKEKLAHAQMELFSRHKVNPLGGCLPILCQMPVFMGLYSALSLAVELRMAPFLWINNLAAPDQLFKLPFAIPFLGIHFNLLPMITIVLFLVQQKMFMPPAMNEEQEVQHKTMTFMTVFMGFMFYKTASGLCIYFIASSLWGLAERQMLPKSKKNQSIPPAPPAPPRKPDGGNSDDGGNGGGGRSKPDNGGGWWQSLLKAADKQTSARRERAKR